MYTVAILPKAIKDLADISSNYRELISQLQYQTSSENASPQWYG